MTSSAYLRLLGVAVLVISVCGLTLPEVNLCSDGDKYPISKGSISGTPADVIRKISGLRSRVECASYCYNEEECKTAVFYESGDCLLVKTYSQSLNVTTEDSTSDISFISLSNYALADGCPEAGCSGTSTCVLHCSGDGTQKAGCIELSTRQYDEYGCEHYPIFQFKEYFMPNLDKETTTNGHVFFTLSFNKIYDWTALRIAWRGTMRGGFGWNGGWIFWRIYINNAQCSDPGYIEGCNYNEESVISHHKATGMEGMCHNIPSGEVSIDLRAYIGTATYGRIGYASHNSKIYVEELGQAGVSANSQTSTGWKCPDLPAYNHRSWVNSGGWGNDYSYTFMSYTYNKLEDETVLKINWDGAIRLYTANTGDSGVCIIYYIQIDGSQCSPQPYGRLLANLNYASHVRNEHRSAEFEGYCQDIAKGHRSISLRIERCPWYTNGDPVGDASTGWNGIRQRMMVEEIRLGTDLVGVMGPDGNIHMIPQFNYAIYAWPKQDRGEDSGVVLSFSYTKKYSSSGLRLTYSGDARNYYGGTGYQPCCRHYFKINDAECSSPGTIEGINYLSRSTNLHRPVLIDGICEGIDAGQLSIDIHAGICKGYSAVGECYFGWNSYLHTLAAETYVTREIPDV